MMPSCRMSRRCFLSLGCRLAGVGCIVTVGALCAGCGAPASAVTDAAPEATPGLASTPGTEGASAGPATAGPGIVETRTTAPAVEASPEPTATPEADSSPAAVTASRACPRGMVNDPYPGRCRLYVDTNGDGFCDLSQVSG